MLPVYSVVIPSFNSAAHIERSVRSVLAQTLNRFELLVVDDGSSDSTASLVERIEDPRIRVLRKQNGGVSSARNYGIEHARAEWVAFLDADDEWCPEFLAAIDQLRCRQPQLIAVGTGVTHADGRPFIQQVETAEGVIVDYFREAIAREGLSCLCSSSTAASREALTRAGKFPLGVTHLEDLDTWMRLAWAGTLGFVDRPLAVYHSEVAGSASKRAAVNKPPVMLETARSAALDGRLSHEMLRGSCGDYVRNWLKAYCRFLAYYGDGAGVLKVLEEFAGPLDVSWKDRLLLRAVASHCAVTAAFRSFLQSCIGWPGPRGYTWMPPVRSRT